VLDCCFALERMERPQDAAGSILVAERLLEDDIWESVLPLVFPVR